MSTTAVLPTQPEERLATLDVLRAFALLGILVVNMWDFAFTANFQPPHERWPAWWDQGSRLDRHGLVRRQVQLAVLVPLWGGVLPAVAAALRRRLFGRRRVPAPAGGLVRAGCLARGLHLRRSPKSSGTTARSLKGPTGKPRVRGSTCNSSSTGRRVKSSPHTRRS